MLIAKPQLILIYPGQERGSSAFHLSRDEERRRANDATEMKRKEKDGEEEVEMETGRGREEREDT